MSEDTLDQWDHAIAPHLRLIELAASQVMLQLGKINTAISMLPAIPSWETNAHYGLAKAEDQVRLILRDLISARERYAQKPRMEAAE